MTRQSLEKQLHKTKAGRTYLQLISEASQENYNRENKRTEIHHIVPRCLRGTNNSENLVSLTVYDHIKAHFFLAKALGNEKNGLLKAFECMCKIHLPSVSELERVDLEQIKGWSRLRDISRKHSLSTKRKISRNTTGKKKVRTKPVSLETKIKISEARKGTVFTQEHRERISEAKKGKPGSFTGHKHSEETKKQMSLAHTGCRGNFLGRYHSEESKEKMKKAHLGKKLSEIDKKHKSEAQKKRWEKYRNSQISI